jgi:hypothetical protein
MWHAPEPREIRASDVRDGPHGVEACRAWRATANRPDRVGARCVDRHGPGADPVAGTRGAETIGAMTMPRRRNPEQECGKQTTPRQSALGAHRFARHFGGTLHGCGYADVADVSAIVAQTAGGAVPEVAFDINRLRCNATSCGEFLRRLDSEDEFVGRTLTPRRNTGPRHGRTHRHVTLRHASHDALLG